MERKHNNTLTFCAMMAALSIVVLLLGSLLPGMRLTVAAIAGMIAALAVLRGGLGYVQRSGADLCGVFWTVYDCQESD